MRALIVALLISLAFSTPAAAQPDVKKRKARALRLFNKGETAYRLGEFKKALAFYKQALKTYRAPAFIFNIAQCHRQLRQYSMALFFYKLFLDEQPNASNKVEVKRFIRKMKKKVAEQARVRQSVGRLSITTDPAGASVYIDRVKGTPNATSPAIVKVSSGEHLLMVKMPGYKTVQKAITIRAKKIAIVRITLERDGRAGVVTPPERRVTPPERRVTPPERRTTTGGEEPTGPQGTKPFYKQWWFWTGAGVAVLALGGAVVTGSRALSLKSEWDDKQGLVDDPDAFKKETKLMGALTDVLIGVSAAAAIGVTVGAILVELKRGKEKASALNVTPSCGATGCGVWVTGRF